MNLKKLALGAAMAAGIAAVPAQASAQFGRGTIETIAAIFLADKLGLDPMMVTGLVGANNYNNGSIFEMAPVFGMQRAYPRATTNQIWTLRRQGLGWGQVAHRIGMQPGEFNQLRNSGRLDPGYYWRDTARNRYGLSDATVNYLRQRGLSWSDITTATVIARESGRNVKDVAYRYLQYRNWNRVASLFGVGSSRIDGRIADWRRTRTVPKQWSRVVVVRQGDDWKDDWKKVKTSKSHKSNAMAGTKASAKAHVKASSKSAVKSTKSTNPGKGHDKNTKAKSSNGTKAKSTSHDKSKSKSNNGKGKGKD